MLASLGRASYHHPWRVFAIWGVVLAALLAWSGALGPAFESDFEIPESEARAGIDILEAHFPDFGGGFGGSVVVEASGGVDDPVVEERFRSLLAEVEEIDGVAVRSPYDPGGERQIAQTGDVAGTIAYADVELDESIDQVEGGEIGKEVADLIDESGLEDVEGVRVEVGGQMLAEFEPPESEAFGLAFAVIVLIIATGSVLAMGVTVGVALIGVAGGVAAISLISNAMSVPEFATTIGVMIGLGVGIDYALFIINRYREMTRAGHTAEDALAIALDTSGRSVLFAGLTVVVSLLGLLLIGLAFVSGLGIAAATIVTVVMAATLTLLPAFVGLVRERTERTRWRGVVATGLVSVALIGVGAGISPLMVGLPLAVVVLAVGSIPFTSNPLRRHLRPRKETPLRDTSWYRWSRLVQARPWRFAIGGTLVLLILAVPMLDLRFGFSDEGNYAEDTTTRQAYDLRAEGFGPGSNGPLLVATEISGPGDLATMAGVATALAETDGVAFASPPIPSEDGAAVIIQVQPTSAPQDEATEELVKRLRDDVIPTATAGTDLDPQVSGFVATSIDFSAYLAGRMLVFFAAVLGVSFVLLMAVFRSLLVPVKAVVMNMLSIAAAYGVVVAIFQWGWLGSIFGVQPAPIEPFIPMMLFAVVFGLSMDYEVFLLSRIKEEYEKGGDAAESVADGLAATARVITTAAAIMIVVFGSFLLEGERTVKLFGMGLAVAVLIDASLVRMLIVPSTMELLGERNWWLPRWLDRILPDLNVEGTQHHLEPAAAEAGDEEADAEREREPVGVG